MADAVVIGDSPSAELAADDVEMQAADADTGDLFDDTADNPGAEPIDLPDIADTILPTAFVEYLKSPIVELSVGTSPASTVLSVHQDLLTRSPFFEKACAELSGPARRIALPDADLEAVGSFVEYLYRGDYFPRSIGSTLEPDPSIPAIDNDGTYLLKHARIYTLAERFQIPALKSLAHSKIQQTTSTALGEIAYARYVYASTSPEDVTIRKPVAAFWGTRSHVLRHEAEEEFRAMCLEFPQFGFDVLSMVLDQKERRTGGGRESAAGPAVTVGVEPPGSSGTPGAGRGRKRARQL